MSLDGFDVEEEQVRLPGHRTRVFLEDGTSWVVRVSNRDKVAWDMTAPRHKWGKAVDVPWLAGTFLAWTASKREGLTDLTWDQFQDACADVSDLPVEEDDAVGPTRKGPPPATS